MTTHAEHAATLAGLGGRVGSVGQSHKRGGWVIEDQRGAARLDVVDEVLHLRLGQRRRQDRDQHIDGLLLAGLGGLVVLLVSLRSLGRLGSPLHENRLIGTDFADVVLLLEFRHQPPFRIGLERLHVHPAEDLGIGGQNAHGQPLLLGHGSDGAGNLKLDRGALVEIRDHDLIEATAGHGSQKHLLDLKSPVPLGLDLSWLDPRQCGLFGSLAQRIHRDDADIQIAAAHFVELPQQPLQLLLNLQLLLGGILRQVSRQCDRSLGIDGLDHLARDRRQRVQPAPRQIDLTANHRCDIRQADHDDSQRQRPDEILQPQAGAAGGSLPMATSDHHRVQIQKQCRDRSEVQHPSQGNDAGRELMQVSRHPQRLANTRRLQQRPQGHHLVNEHEKRSHDGGQDKRHRR